MKYITIWNYEPANVEAISKRFKETGGQPPAEVTLLGRWFDLSGGRGFSVSESDDPIAMQKFVAEWSDLMSFEITPVLDDEMMAKALQD